jgi:DNA polymerase-3 subunit chi
MADVGFYHLTRSTLDQALPKLLSRTLAAGQRALVVGTDLAALSEALWAQRDWLPHGTEADGDPDLQPIWLSPTADAANGARYVFLVQGAATDRLAEYDRAFDLFDGTSPDAVDAARSRWRSAKDQGHALTYWQQTDSGWKKKA